MGITKKKKEKKEKKFVSCADIIIFSLKIGRLTDRFRSEILMKTQHMRISFRSFCSSLSASRIQSFCEIIGHSVPNLNFAKPRRSTSEISDVLLRVKATIITNFWMVSRDTRLLGLRRGRFSSRSQLFSGVSVSAQNEAYDIALFALFALITTVGRSWSRLICICIAIRHY